MTNKRDTKFKPGNPGKPKGARHKTTLAIEQLLDGEAETITRKAIEEAKAGNMAAIKLCLDHLAPPRKDRAISFDMPNMETAADAVCVMGGVIEAVANGEMTPSEGQAVAALVETFRRTIATGEHEQRLAALEAEIAA